MTEIRLSSCDPLTLLSHLAVYGLAAILESEGAPDVRVWWTDDVARPRPVVSVSSLDEAAVAGTLNQHARSRGAAGAWVQRDISLGGTGRGLMSPRLSSFKDKDTWNLVQRSRHEVVDSLMREHSWLDLRFLAALGEPCYWKLNRTGGWTQDNGASRLEMQPRNQGSEFVGNRLRKLAQVVAARDPSKILAGLCGESVRDEIGDDRPDSRTATGLASPGPTDSALAWCALWGISQFPTTLLVRNPADTAGHFEFRRNEWFYVPVWHEPWRPARVRSILASRPLRVLASDGITVASNEGLQRPYSETEVSEARAWLQARRIVGVVRFPILKFGSANAPERRSMGGEPVSVATPARRTS